MVEKAKSKGKDRARVTHGAKLNQVQPGQAELNGMPPDSELSRLTKLYADQKRKVNDVKSELFDTERNIAAELKKEKRRDVKAAGFQFTIRTGADELVIKKI